ncbi:lipopolysaccharide-induced tumor necrosis factor-alpha factor homolog isoform X1 [Ascaphus truei]|uniref:lipopolysaccharide-induced tumor necrosis factor-alpha factor homolog isoform X1 n=1 Tax=Ascaphus truei TaxID=8439 RepID=UPI003F59B8FD
MPPTCSSPPPYQSKAPENLSAPQFCMQPVPIISQPLAPSLCYCIVISEIPDSTQPRVLYQQQAPVCTVEIAAQPAASSAPTGVAMQLGDQAGVTKCPFCHENIVTRVTYHCGLLTWLLCIGLMWFGCVLGCCFIPFCVRRTKNVNHFCPRCNCHIFRHDRL